jgi:hypothetical protein
VVLVSTRRARQAVVRVVGRPRTNATPAIAMPAHEAARTRG